MASTAILTLVCLAFPFGQLLRLNLNGISFPFIDLLLAALLIANSKLILKLKNHYLVCFLAFAWFSFIVNTVFRYPSWPKPLLYLLRLSSYLILLNLPLKINPQVKKLFNLCLIANIIFGFIQYFFWPDLTYFNIFNWDPHLYRLVSSFFDPAFTGLIYLLFLIYLYHQQSKSKIPLAIITYIALALTYSRASLLSLILVSIFLSFKKKQKNIFWLTLLVVAVTVCILPRQPGEGTKLERSSTIRAKIENYQEGLTVFAQSPIIGHGYNHLFSARPSFLPQSHANSGFDSSLLTILTTTGLVGFYFFTKFIIRLFSQHNLQYQSLLLAIFFHSFFSNSMFYPWVIVFILLHQMS